MEETQRLHIRLSPSYGEERRSGMDEGNGMSTRQALKVTAMAGERVISSQRRERRFYARAGAEAEQGACVKGR